MVRQGKILGHIVFENGISTDADKVKVILELPRPTNAKGVQCFIGHCGYYHRFIYMYAIIAKPLYALLLDFEWTNECEEAFEKFCSDLQNVWILLKDMGRRKPGGAICMPYYNEINNILYSASKKITEQEENDHRTMDELYLKRFIEKPITIGTDGIE